MHWMGAGQGKHRAAGFCRSISGSVVPPAPASCDATGHQAQRVIEDSTDAIRGAAGSPTGSSQPAPVPLTFWPKVVPAASSMGPCWPSIHPATLAFWDRKFHSKGS